MLGKRTQLSDSSLWSIHSPNCTQMPRIASPASPSRRSSTQASKSEKMNTGEANRTLGSPKLEARIPSQRRSRRTPPIQLRRTHTRRKLFGGKRSSPIQRRRRQPLLFHRSKGREAQPDSSASQPCPTRKQRRARRNRSQGPKAPPGAMETPWIRKLST